VSWLFSFLLLCYVLVRIVLRVRGQIRWLSIRKTLPVPPPIVAAPEHLSAPLAELFVRTLALRAELVCARRELSAVAVKDPDAPLGRVRDARYRRTLLTSWSRLNAWLRALDRLDAASMGQLRDVHLDGDTIAQLRDSLHDKWYEASRARALDPFALEHLLAVQQTFERVELELESIEQGLAQLAQHPYRDRHDRHASEVVPRRSDFDGSRLVPDAPGFVARQSSVPHTLPPRFAPGTPGPSPQTIKITATGY
jgi:hypothetical protein